MTRTLILTLILSLMLLVSIKLSAQESSNSKFISVGIIPTMLLEPTTQSLGIAFEHSIIEKLTIELTYGLDLNWEPLSNSHPAPNFRHHEYKVFLKYRLNDSFDKVIYPYVGLDYFGIRNSFERTNSFYQENNTYYSYDRSSVSRQVNGVRFNLGVKLPVGKHIYIDTYGGIGTRSVNVTHSAINKTEIEPNFSITSEFFTPLDERAGKRRVLALSFGFKVAYRIY